MADNPSALAWKIPWTEKPGGLQSMGSQKSRTQLSNLHRFCRELLKALFLSLVKFQALFILVMLVLVYSSFVVNIIPTFSKII